MAVRLKFSVRRCLFKILEIILKFRCLEKFTNVYDTDVSTYY